MKTGKCPDDLFFKKRYLPVSFFEKKKNYTLNGYAEKAVTPGS